MNRHDRDAIHCKHCGETVTPGDLAVALNEQKHLYNNFESEEFDNCDYKKNKNAAMHVNQSLEGVLSVEEV